MKRHEKLDTLQQVTVRGYNRFMIIIDIETTGVDSKKNSIVSIGAVNFEKPDQSFYEECRAWDNSHIDPVALEVNGFTEDEVRDSTKHSEGDILTSFFKWLDAQDDLVVAGQNVFFDCDFLRDAAMRWNIPYFLSRRIIDLHSITYFHMIQRGITPPLLNRKTHLDSDKIMEYVGIPTEPKPHKAINGAVWEAEAFSRLLHNVSLFEQFQKYPILW